MNTYYCTKKRCTRSPEKHLDIRKVKILTKSNVSEENKVGIETEFGVKFVEHELL